MHHMNVCEKRFLLGRQNLEDQSSAQAAVFSALRLLTWFHGSTRLHGVIGAIWGLNGDYDMITV